MIKPTDEQQLAIEVCRHHPQVVVSALAGTGKTTTLDQIARSQPSTLFRYVAFNRTVVEEAKARFPANVKPYTAHGMAMRSVGRLYAHRLNSRRQSAREICGILGIDSDTPIVCDLDGGATTTLPASILGGLAKQTVDSFCRSADPALSRAHVPYIKGIDDPAKFDSPNNDMLTERVLPLAQYYWDDLCSTEGQLRFDPNHYLKIWTLRGAIIDADCILFDEAQDANPAMAQACLDQGVPIVWVGDSQQAIYEWNGAINSLAKAVSAGAVEVTLTQSWRFGPEIAARANIALSRLGSPYRVTGMGSPGTVGRLSSPDVVLARTNLGVLETIALAADEGKVPHVVGGTDAVVAFLDAADRLKAGHRTSHPELAAFANWNEVLAYVKRDPSGKDLEMLVLLVDEMGPEIRHLLRRCSRSADHADVIISTVHKAKGLEWEKVQLASDFPIAEDSSPSQLRVLYVALTRARAHLDDSRVDVSGSIGRLMRGRHADMFGEITYEFPARGTEGGLPRER